jgi:chromosomal replication initiator protein
LNNKEIWQKCLSKLELELGEREFNMWIKPLHADVQDKKCLLYAPNKFVKDWVEEHLSETLSQTVQLFSTTKIRVELIVGDNFEPKQNPAIENRAANKRGTTLYGDSTPNSVYTFASHVEGKSNQIARAASQQVGENPGTAYNPLYIYGGVGLGKTHLMHAAGNIIGKNKARKVIYTHSERFVSDMVKALQRGKMDDFKAYYRSVDALLIDDIQFFSGKSQSQEEFFHTFNTLMEAGSQIIIASDRFPKEINGVQERLISRFESGLTVRVDPPELETRVAILRNKAKEKSIELPEEVAFMVAKHIRSNVRELEGALHRLIAGSAFTGNTINLESARLALQDLTLFQERKVSVENIQKTIADYYNMRVSDLKSKKRNRQIARPRQIAMALSKELTNLSLPDIGDAFGGRDHTTVLHACRKINTLINEDALIKDDYNSLLKILGG